MAYWLTAFGGVNVPTNLGNQGSMDVATGTPDAPLIQLPGGRVFDPLGSGAAFVPSAQYIAHVMVVSDVKATIKGVVDAWQALRGTVGTLTRTPDDGSTAQTITARLIKADVVNRRPEGPKIVRMDLVFQAIKLPWASGGATYNLTKATASVTNFTTTVTNAGNVTQRILQLSATPAAATTMTHFQISSPIAPLLQWSGSVAATKILLIDTAKRQVFNDGAVAYSGLTVPTNSEDWFAIAAGGNLLTYQATYAGGTGVNVSVGFADAWG